MSGPVSDVNPHSLLWPGQVFLVKIKTGRKNELISIFVKRRAPQAETMKVTPKNHVCTDFFVHRIPCSYRAQRANKIVMGY